MFRAKQTKYKLFYARKCQKRLKKPQKHKLALQHMTIIFDSNLFAYNIIYQTLFCAMFRA